LKAVPASKEILMKFTMNATVLSVIGCLNGFQPRRFMQKAGVLPISGKPRVTKWIGTLTVLILSLSNMSVCVADDLRAKVQNPVSSMYSLPLKLTVDSGAPNGSAYFLNANPVIPVTVGDWNLINRALIPAWVSVDGYIEGTPAIPQGQPANDRKSGLGDINYSLFVSPNKTIRFSKKLQQA